MIGRSVASAIRRKCVDAPSRAGFCPPRRKGFGRKDQQTGRAALCGHAGDAGRLQAAVGVDAVHEGKVIADLIYGDVENAPLLLERAGCDLAGMRIDRERGDPGDGGKVAQVLAIRSSRRC